MVQTNFEAVGDTRFVITLPDADSINHVVVFMTGAQPFPDDLGGGVYFSWPSPDGAPEWHFLGTITNQKPSAIFKISGLKKTSMPSENPFLLSHPQQSSHHAQIGISAEPLSVVCGLTPATDAASTQSWQLEFARSMCENLHNYSASYARSIQQLPSAGYGPNETFVPLSSLVNWYNNFTRKLHQNTNFWRS
ncbi:protein OPI10 homolog isoform X2 [Hyalella azteca]|uniref:Protein OPI10 homolog isoform X2 n=1 Tax=Hyalella azteca TaxID=294128 RepID=A0A8B7PE18_HYAAZ|nr:protein OPI10 homolog isoform X2 [Hyalella azteca]